MVGQPQLDDHGHTEHAGSAARGGFGVCARHLSPDHAGGSRGRHPDLPGAAAGRPEQPGFRGFYLLADRAARKLITISLWDCYDDARAVEAQAARLRHEAAAEIGTAAPAVNIDEVVVQS